MQLFRTKAIWVLIFQLYTLHFLQAEHRLSQTVKPERYEIEWQINPEKEAFSGEERIDVLLSSPADAITLHSVGLEITKAEILINGDARSATVRSSEMDQTITLNASEKLPAKRITLRLKWNGRLRKDLRGFYMAQAQGERYALTQFYPGDARLAFPCFDEPALKAHFSVTAIIPEKFTAISNGRILKEIMDPATHTKTVRFSETPLMSSYLLAVAIGPYEAARSHAGRIPIAVWTPPGKRHLATYSLKVAEEILPIFEDYFGKPYTYEKLDLIVAPEFQYGAMENIAAIFLRDSTLLVDPQHASVSIFKSTAGTLAHEIAHQWFGDLVTMKWWDDIWLSESFADWMGEKVIDRWRPEWRESSYSVIPKTRSMKDDALKSTHPIRVPLDSPEQANEVLDAITYSKGASILRMFESWLSEPVFRRGIQNYIEKHQYANATASDFWNALEQASGLPVVSVGTSWTDQAGFPLVSLSVLESNDQISLLATQRRYFAFGERSQQHDQLWKIPFCIQFSTGAKKEFQCFLLEQKETRIRLPKVRWLYANANEAGYYYVQHDPKILAGLLPFLQQLSAQERAGLLSSEWAAVLSGSAEISNFMTLLSSYKGEREGVLATRMAEIAETIYKKVLDDPSLPAWEAFVRDLFTPTWKQMGWTPDSKDTDDEMHLRATVLQTLTELGQPEQLIHEVETRFEQYLKNPSSLDRSLSSAVIHAAAKVGGPEHYKEFLNRLKNVEDPQEKERFLDALSLFEDPELAKRTFDLAVHVQNPITRDTAAYVIQSLFENRAVQNEVWGWTRQSWPVIKKNLTPFFHREIVQGARELCDPGIRNEVAQFFGQSENATIDDRTLTQTLESIDGCVSLRERGHSSLSSWLKQRYR